MQSLDDDGDLPELEGGGTVNKSDSKAESNNSTGKDDTPTETVVDSTEEITVALPATNEQSSTVEDNKTGNDTIL